MTTFRNVTVGEMTIANDKPFTLIAGPCQIQSRDHALMVAKELVSICDRVGINVIYKSSYDKANRSSVDAARGIGMEEGLRILEDVRADFDCPVLTDVHGVEQARAAGRIVDVLQIPAFLCRQTDLLIAAGETGCTVNIKKGQFLAPWDMTHVAAKVASTGNQNIMLTERGTSFGYNTLVGDMRALPQMAQTGYPVIMDATHSVQQPGGLGGSSGGQRELAPVMARAALAVGVAGVFIETHEDPDNAPCDGPNMIPLSQMEGLLRLLKEIDLIAKANPVVL